MPATRLAVCVLALAACGLREKDRCTVTADCLDGAVCCNATCTPAASAACGPLTRFTKLALAHTFSCGLGDNNAIYCWGGNAAGELGDGSHIPHARPGQVGTAYEWTDVAAATFFACGLKVDHSMWCWGFGVNGEIGDGRATIESQPTEVVSDKPGVGWKEMSLGEHFACGLHLDGSIACWGRDRASNTSIDKPRAVDGNTDWTHVSAGGDAHCGLRGEGKLFCWGRAATGQLGLGSVAFQPSPAQVGSDTWNTVELGASTACAIRSDGALFCWGNNLATSPALQYGNSPLRIGNATDWTSISVSRWTIIGARAGAGSFAWGRSYRGAPFGDEDSETAEPRPVAPTTSGWSELRSGNSHVCGISGNLAYCWGALGDGMLGDGATATLARPARIGSDPWTAIATGDGQCGLRSDGALLCWGDDPLLGVGFGTTDPVWAPARLGSDTFSAVAMSNSLSPGQATCAIRGGDLLCWGENTSGQLGLGNTESPQLSPAPVSLANVPGGTQWSEVAVAGHTCAIASTGALWCWGVNETGQLGSGAASTTPTTAPTAALGATWLHVAVTDYDYHIGLTCGIRTDHTLWCWGQDQPPTTAQHLAPTQIGSASTWASVAVGPATGTATSSATICAVQMNGTLWCWGQWLDGGKLNTSMFPVQVGRDTDWSSVSVGTELCATKTGGTLWCWANLSWLGDGSPLIFDPQEVAEPATRPTQIGSDSDWRTVQTGGMPCATKTDGSLWCWGTGAAPIPQFITTPTLVD